MIKVNKRDVELDGAKDVLVAESILALVLVFRKLNDHQKDAFLETLYHALKKEIDND